MKAITDVLESRLWAKAYRCNDSHCVDTVPHLTDSIVIYTKKKTANSYIDRYSCIIYDMAKKLRPLLLLLPLSNTEVKAV